MNKNARGKRIISCMLAVLMVLTALIPIGLPVFADEAVKKIKIIFVLGTEGYAEPMSEAYRRIKDNYPIELKVFGASEVKSPERLAELQKEVAQADIVSMEMLGSTTKDIISEINKNAGASCLVYSTKGTNYAKEFPKIDYSMDSKLSPYFNNGSLENMRRMLLLLGVQKGLIVNEPLTFVAVSGRVAYHPDASVVSFDSDAFYETSGALITQESDATKAALLLNTMYRAVYDKSIGTSSLTTPAALTLTPAETTPSALGAVMPTLTESMATTLLTMVATGKEETNEAWKMAFANLSTAENIPLSLKAMLNEKSGREERLVAIDAAWHVALSRPLNPEYKSELVKNLNQAVYSAMGIPESEAALSVELLKTYDDLQQILEKPTLTPGCFKNRESFIAWYQASGRYKAESPWVGVVAHNSMLSNNDMAMYTALQKSLESKNANVMLLFSDIDRQKLHDEFLVVDGKTKIDALVASIGFNYVNGKPAVGTAMFQSLDVPVLSPIYSGDISNWEESITGFQSEINYQVALPEMDGRIEPILMGGAVKKGIDPDTGAAVIKRMPLAYNIERLAGRAMTWAKLKTQSNAQKKVAIVYYNHDGGKDGISASYLNVTKSTVNTLMALKEKGYLIDGDISTENIEKLMFQQGRNVGAWAPGEIEKLVNAGAMTISVDEYMAWYNTLPQKLRTDIEKDWGPAPGKMMVYNNKIIIPGIMLSNNVYLGPQPMRGWMEDTSKIAHSTTLSPPHQYVAYYLWLQHKFQADAVIHMGTHGTLEWLPGHSVGMGEDDWPDQLIGNMININPYIVNNPGEGTQAKRRGYAVTISHMIPVMLQPELYGDLEKIQNLIIQYEKEVADGQLERAQKLKSEIVPLVKSGAYDRDLKLNLDSDFDNSVAALHDYLESFSEALMPYGLHTLGEFPDGELRSKMVDAIVSFDPATREPNRSSYANVLGLCTQEMQSVMKALEARFIEPGMGKDPIRVPEAMPTGRNIISFDSREVPDKAAWEIGKNAADQLIREYQASHGGKTPESVGVVLWAIETMRTRGESVAMILRLMGAEPVWDKSNRVSEVTLTPVSVLGRPRVDVVVTISGLFRDTFPTTIDMLDDAFRKVAKQDETPDSNYIKKHRDTFYNQLIASGKPAVEADALAGSRIFGDAPGTYGTGVATKGEATADWNTRQDLLDTYMNRMSYIYGKGVSGQYAKEAFVDALKQVEATVQIRDSIYGVLDNDDVAQYLGGLLMAAKAASGKDVDTYIADTRKPGVDMVSSLKEFTAKELRTRILNPKWIEGMLTEGVDGSREVAKQVGNMFLMDATADAINDEDWKDLVKTYINNEAVRKQLDPYTLQSMIGWAMEASRKDLWKADQKDLANLADAYVESAVKYGVVCCHHTCANLKLDEYVADFSTLDNNKLTEFKQVFKEATKHDLNIKMKETPVEPKAPVIPNVTQKEPQKETAVPERNNKTHSEKSDAVYPEKIADQPPLIVPALENQKVAESETVFAENIPSGAVSVQKSQIQPTKTAKKNATVSDESVAKKRKSSPSTTSTGAGEAKRTESKPAESAPVGRAFEVIKSVASDLAMNASGVSAMAVAAVISIGALIAFGYFRRK